MLTLNYSFLFKSLMSNTTEAVHLLEKKLKNLLSNYDFLLKEK